MSYVTYREEWRRLYLDEKMPISSIAEAYGCTGRTVLNHLAALGIDTSDPFSRFVDEWVAFRERGWSYAAIARRYGCGSGTVRSRLKGKAPAPLQGCGDLTRTFVCKMEHRASRYGRAWAVDAEYLWGLFLKQERRCALSGIELTMQEPGKYYGTASLDRIDSAEGYVPGNVQWVHATLNVMKNDLSQTDFVAWCKAVARYATAKA